MCGRTLARREKITKLRKGPQKKDVRRRPKWIPTAFFINSLEWKKQHFHFIYFNIHKDENFNKITSFNYFLLLVTIFQMYIYIVSYYTDFFLTLWGEAKTGTKRKRIKKNLCPAINVNKSRIRA